MDPIICKRRTSIAQDNIDVAAKLLAEKIGVLCSADKLHEPDALMLGSGEAS